MANLLQASLRHKERGTVLKGFASSGLPVQLPCAVDLAPAVWQHHRPDVAGIAHVEGSRDVFGLAAMLCMLCHLAGAGLASRQRGCCMTCFERLVHANQAQWRATPTA